MPDGGWNVWWSGATFPPPPAPATKVYPSRSRPEMIVDTWGVFLADPEGNLIGFNANWGGGSAPVNATVYAGRSGTRDL